MTDLILHAYDLSPFALKVRLALGYKGLRWHVVDTAIWPPRPKLEPLTAGYRRIPVLQLGADVFCDTALILREIDRRHPEPTLYPDGDMAFAEALAAWADAALFMPAALMATSVIGDAVPAEFIADRIEFMRTDFRQAPSLEALPLNRQKVTAVMMRLAAMLADGRGFLLGGNLSVADLAAYHPLAFVRQHGGNEIEAMLPFPALLPWMQRVAAVGHGQPEPMAPEQALAIARDADPALVTGVAVDDPCGLEAGTTVVVHSGDPGEPIRGELVAADADSFIVRHRHEAVGTVHIHFPRLGYAALRA